MWLQRMNGRIVVIIAVQVYLDADWFCAARTPRHQVLKSQPPPRCVGQPGGEARQCCGTQPCLALKVVQQAVDVLASTASAGVAAAFLEPRKRMMSCVDARLIAAVPVVPPSTTWHHPREALRPLAASMRRAPLDSLSSSSVGMRRLNTSNLWSFSATIWYCSNDGWGTMPRQWRSCGLVQLARRPPRGGQVTTVDSSTHEFVTSCDDGDDE